MYIKEMRIQLHIREYNRNIYYSTTNLKGRMKFRLPSKLIPGIHINFTLALSLLEFTTKNVSNAVCIQ